MPWNERSCVFAPTVVTHGRLAGPPIVPAPLPELPADVATQTFALAANRNAMSSEPVTLAPPPIE